MTTIKDKICTHKTYKEAEQALLNNGFKMNGGEPLRGVRYEGDNQFAFIIRMGAGEFETTFYKKTSRHITTEHITNVLAIARKRKLAIGQQINAIKRELANNKGNIDPGYREQQLQRLHNLQDEAQVTNSHIRTYGEYYSSCRDMLLLKRLREQVGEEIFLRLAKDVDERLDNNKDTVDYHIDLQRKHAIEIIEKAINLDDRYFLDQTEELLRDVQEIIMEI